MKVIKILDYICCCFVSTTGDEPNVPFSQLSNTTNNTITSNNGDIDNIEEDEILNDEKFQILLTTIQNDIDLEEDKINYIISYLRDNNCCIYTDQTLQLLKFINFSTNKFNFLKNSLPFIIDLNSGKKKIIESINFYNDKLKLTEMIQDHLNKRKINKEKEMESMKHLENMNFSNYLFNTLSNVPLFRSNRSNSINLSGNTSPKNIMNQPIHSQHQSVVELNDNYHSERPISPIQEEEAKEHSLKDSHY
ncbi:hypothetical protein ABK040_013656 [Willaertia magna]